MSAASLPVYVRVKPVQPMPPFARAFAIAVAAGCFALLLIAYRLTPNTTGMGTHQQLGLAPCGFVYVFGLPCPSCGYTTSFSLFSHGRLLASLENQPAGFAIAVATAMSAWVSLYVGLTGKPIHRLFVRYVTPVSIFQAGLFILLAWAYKIAMVKMGH